MTYDLQLSNVGKVYDDGTAAVVDFNLNVNKGEFIAFLGPSGCGKTTTLRMIGGFEDITSGDISIKGMRINDLLPEHRPTSMIFQSYALFPHMTVRQNVAFGLEVKKVPRAECERKVDGILEKLELLDIAEMRTDKLSGGQLQRIALARSLVVEPDILLLDEPLGALDANLRKSIQNELKLLQRDLGITFIFVTHAQSEALALSDRIVVMNNGRIEQISSPYELYTRPETLFVAKFIGNNAVVPGSVRSVDGDTIVLDTEFGPLAAGIGSTKCLLGDQVNLVLPAESMYLLPTDAPAENSAHCVIKGVIKTLTYIGHVVQMQVTLPNGEAIGIEGHADKYGGRFAAGEDVLVAWRTEGACVIAS